MKLPSTLVFCWLILVSLACGGQLDSQLKVVLGEYDIYDSCSKPHDNCVRMDCALSNTGGGSGTATLRFTLTQDKDVLTHDEIVHLKSKEHKRVTHDFVEAQPYDENTYGQCSLLDVKQESP